MMDEYSSIIVHPSTDPSTDPQWMDEDRWTMMDDGGWWMMMDDDDDGVWWMVDGDPRNVLSHSATGYLFHQQLFLFVLHHVAHPIVVPNFIKFPQHIAHMFHHLHILLVFILYHIAHCRPVSQSFHPMCLPLISLCPPQLIKGSERIVHFNYFSSSSPLPITSLSCLKIPSICNANDISLTESCVHHIAMQQLNDMRQCAQKNQGQ